MTERAYDWAANARGCYDLAISECRRRFLVDQAERPELTAEQWMAEQEAKCEH